MGRPGCFALAASSAVLLWACGGEDTCQSAGCDMLASTANPVPGPTPGPGFSPTGPNPAPAPATGPQPMGGAGPDSSGPNAPVEPVAPGPMPNAGPGPAMPTPDGGDASLPGPGATPDGGPGAEPAPGPDPSMAVWHPDAAWDCGLAAGIPVPEDGDPVFTVEMNVEVFDLGETQFGKRQIFNAKDGTVSGDVRGTVLPGAYDYQLILDNGVVEIEQIGVLRLDGGNVYFRHCGVAPDIDTPARVVADFEAPSRGSHAGLNEGSYIAARAYDAAQKKLVLEFYAHTGAGAADRETLSIPAPQNTLRQQWECPEYTGRPGDVVYRESVGIGGSVSVGASKNGSRNIIPITGGSTRDMLVGTVQAGGADYQLTSGSFFLDARYVIRSEDGVLVAVRNCGPASTLVPTFETSKDGPYAFFNENNWLSSSPSIAIGAVNLTIYEKL